MDSRGGSRNKNLTMVKSAKLVAIRRHGRQVLLVRRREDKRWMFPGGRRKQMPKESPKACLRRELREELPKLKVGGFRRWKREPVPEICTGR
jgi:8-oxo-dGTP pyrophosphatase MutT (NUDIX family)